MRPYTVVTDEHLLAAIAREIESADVIGLDLETAKIGGGGSFDPLTGRPRLFSVNTGQGLYLIDLYKTKTLGPVLDAFRRTKGVTVGQNMKFDQKWLLWHFDLEIGKLFDTLRASSIIYAGLPGLKHDLWSLYKRELGEAATVEDLGGSDWDGTLTQRQLDYAADDIDKLPRLRDVLKKKIVDARLVKIAQLEFNAVLPEACMELNGFFLNKDMWLTRTASDRVQLERLRVSLLSKLPNPSNQLGLFGPAAFNLDSTDQLLRSLGMLGVKQKWKDPETGLTKTVPLMDTKEMTLAMEADRWPILKEVIEYRGYAQSVKAFGEEYLKNIHPTSGRIHSSYFPFTDTGRYACVAPWTPVRTREGAKPILDVRVGDEVWTHKERWRRVLAFLPQGSLQTYAVTFSTGDILTCSASHRLLLSDGNWRTVGEMFHERFQHRREPEEQLSGQSCAGHRARAPGYSLFAGEGQHVVAVEEINLAGRLEVYDLTVEDDESYDTYGVFSHNCRGPNLQQVPRGGAFRDCFRAEPGRTLAIADWSNIEMRIVAEISKDPVLIKVFRDDRDAHYATASLVTGKPESEIVKAERQQAKPVNFGFIYGMQAARLVMYAKQGYGVSFTENQARTFRRRFFEAYAGIDSWHRLAMDSGKRQRETRTAWGRRRIIKDEKAHNEFYNSPIQGTGADGLKVAIRNVYDRMKKLAGRTPLLGKGAKCAPVHMVHDEIVCEHDEDPELEIHVRQELHDGMIEGIAPMLPSVPTRAEVGGGRSWASKS